MRSGRIIIKVPSSAKLAAKQQPIAFPNKRAALIDPGSHPRHRREAYWLRSTSTTAQR